MTNSGETDSGTQSVQVGTPDGVSLSGGSGKVSPNAPALRRFSAFLTPAAADDNAGDEDLVDCGAADCTYTVPANSTLTVTLALTITPAAADGEVTLTLPGSKRVSLPLTVAAGITSLNFDAPSAGWHAGTTVTTPLTATVATGVATPGSIILQLRNGDLWITDYHQASCTPVGTTAIECDPLSSQDEDVDFGLFGLTLLPAADGEQTVDATLEGGQTLAVQSTGDSHSAPITAERLSARDPITMTGPFNGAIIGAANQYCPTTDRWNCVNGSSDWNPLNAVVPLPVQLSGKQVVMARLNWAVSAANASSNLNGSSSAQLTTNDGTSVSLEGTPVDIDQARTSRDAHIVEYTATLRNPAALAEYSTVSVAGISPDGSHGNNGNGHAYGHERLAMIAWTLTIVWIDASTDATVRAYSNPVLLTGEDDTLWTEPSPTPGQLDHLDLALWGVDDLGIKTVTAGQALIPIEPTGCSPLQGMIYPPNGDVVDTCSSVGFGLIHLKAAEPNRATDPIKVSANADTVWVSGALVVRSSVVH